MKKRIVIYSTILTDRQTHFQTNRKTYFDTIFVEAALAQSKNTATKINFIFVCITGISQTGKKRDRCFQSYPKIQKG